MQTFESKNSKIVLSITGKDSVIIVYSEKEYAKSKDDKMNKEREEDMKKYNNDPNSL